ncbi:PPOX class F420-dependent oxidoreductase [Hoyosella sp. G463]|uniref:PPOX class F420-dependent oxidoreductase n=1 Tax=Lolliginicoccus lacisalsi TaxID=2742202 RepID=A0A927JD42_9ACTN|nr:PPOX class F420-dependent oxidoreductase [Lolliginicoccus lacisalsi]MBD8506836.1 PPOX class F420-dependent oxidoreductase [Lolliginicoccus lacisalsi]
MAPTFEDLAAAKYVLLTTFRKDGTAVGTPLWVAADGQRLLVWTETNSYKVKRIRRDPRVTIAVCGARGKPNGEAVEGRAEVLEQEGTELARRLISEKYGILGKLIVKGSLLRRGRRGTIGVAIELV